MTTITDAAPIHTPIDRPRTWADDDFHASRQKPLAVVPERQYTSRMVFHTVWRSDAPEGIHTMQVTSDQPIVIARAKREPKPNPFDAHIVTFATAYNAESGKSGRITLEAGDVLSTVIRNLRKAARGVDKSVVIAYDPGKTGKDSTSFRFMLKPKVAPKSKPADADTPVIVVPPATPAVKSTKKR